LKDAYVDIVEGSENGEFKLSAAAWENFAAIERAFPDRTLRAHTLFLVTPRNPQLAQELDPTEGNPMRPRSGVGAKRSTMQDSRRFLWESTTRARILLTRIISQTGELQKWRQMWLPKFAGWQKRMAGPIRQCNETEHTNDASIGAFSFRRVIRRNSL
jgi:hypothetical protein